MAWVRSRVNADGARRYYGYYRDPQDASRSAGSFATHRAAQRAAYRLEQQVHDGSWLDDRAGRVTFGAYVEGEWLPSRQLELSTMAGYRSVLDHHFLPAFGEMPLAKVLPSAVQSWVTGAVEGGLSAQSVKKYHRLLHSIFGDAVRDRLVGFNPCEGTHLPKIIARETRTLTPQEFTALLAAIDPRHRLLVETAIETGMRWGELTAMRPRHIDFLRGLVTVQETLTEVATKYSPTADRFVIKPYPKGNRPRTFGVRPAWLETVAAHLAERGIGRDDLLFATETGGPLSRGTFRNRVWLPAVRVSGIDFGVRMHDLRHAHASWLLAGGADLVGVMERLGHRQIQTTQRYLHTLPTTDQKNLDALSRITRA